MLAGRRVDGVSEEVAAARGLANRHHPVQRQVDDESAGAGTAGSENNRAPSDETAI